MHRSHKSQELQNYFPPEETRVREIPFTTDAQLLNAVAVQLESVERRMARELGARSLLDCPAHLDNRGVYYAVKLDNQVVVEDGKLDIVEGYRDGAWHELSLFDDELPTPASYELDTDRETVEFTTSLLFDVTGTGDAVAQIWDVKQFALGELKIPNRLYFWVEGAGERSLALDIFIEGERFPRSVWAANRRKDVETVTSMLEGLQVTKNIWSVVNKITVRGLPAGARLRCWSMSFELPAVLDIERPYTHPFFRDLKFDRYWQISPKENLLKELYLADNYSGLEYIQSYSMPQLLTALAIEPRTAGMLGASGASLLYWDRREPMPDKTHVTALTREPSYGLDCSYDITRPGAVRWLQIQPVAYDAATIDAWRYLVEDPDDNLYALLPDGSFAPYSGGSGWQRGKPKAVSMALAKTGTYVITLETINRQNELTADSFPYANHAIAGARVFNLNKLVPEIRGISYDALGQLWIWTGDYAVPIKPVYDSYILDAASRTIYVTQAYEQVRYE